jgi:hypothetical protein
VQARLVIIINSDLQCSLCTPYLDILSSASTSYRVGWEEAEVEPEAFGGLAAEATDSTVCVCVCVFVCVCVCVCVFVCVCVCVCVCG